jgi:beta-barrel assembly-enhancing protease
MSRLIGLILLLCWPAIAQAAPAPGQIAAYRALVQQDLRLAIISHRLASANAPFCKRRERNPGLVLHDELQYPDLETARAAFGFRQPVSISAVVPGGAADVLGIKAGDGLVAINDQLPGAETEIRGRQSADRVEDIQRELRQRLEKGEPVKLTLDTPDGKKQFSLSPPAICASRFWVDAKSGIDAGADGDGVRITEGMMIFTGQDDAELAAVVAHELAHNLLGHRERLKSAKGGTKAILATEIEADRLSVWLMANAGYDPQAALRFIERQGRKYGLGIFSDGTHLRWKNRRKVMQAEIDLMAQTPKQSGLLPPPLLAGG